MREIGHSKGTSKPWIKIAVLALGLLFIFIGAVKFFNLGKLFFRGPATFVQLITNTGLKSENNRVNVLLLGIGGEGHEGPYLSDTMILASIDKDGKDVALVSLPRDLWVPGISAKINSAYAFGIEKGDGLEVAKKSVSELFGIPVHYALRVDFKGFEKAIDQVEGIDVDVETAFVDPKYPIAGKEDDTCGLTVENQLADGFVQVVVKDATGSATIVTEDNNPFTCRYETISFQKGSMHMDGETTLKFVRSRHGTNDEGSDFARSARQQKVILAFRQNVLSVQTLLNPKTIIDLTKTFGASIDTDIDDEDTPHFAKLFQKVEPQRIRHVVLDSGRDESVLVVGNPADYKGQYALVPKSSSWQELAEYIQGEIFKLEEK